MVGRDREDLVAAAGAGAEDRPRPGQHPPTAAEGRVVFPQRIVRQHAVDDGLARAVQTGADLLEGADRQLHPAVVRAVLPEVAVGRDRKGVVVTGGVGDGADPTGWFRPATASSSRRRTASRVPTASGRTARRKPPCRRPRFRPRVICWNEPVERIAQPLGVCSQRRRSAVTANTSALPAESFAALIDRIVPAGDSSWSVPSGRIAPGSRRCSGRPRRLRRPRSASASGIAAEEMAGRACRRPGW